jgi:opine dehydrogenase
MAVAADLATNGRDVVIADVPEFPEQTAAIRERGGVTVASGWGGPQTIEMKVADEIDEAVSEAGLVIICVTAPAHARFVEAAIPGLASGGVILFMGEGGGSLVAWPALRRVGRTDIVVGETNCLPFIARTAGPGSITIDRKRGGVLIAALPAPRTDRLRLEVADVWPSLEEAESVLETALVNYDAIDVIPVAVANAGTIEGRSGGILLWGEGATPSVVRLIEAVDGELLALRESLGFSDRRRYRDFLIAQGLAPDLGDLYQVMRAGGIMRSVRPSGSSADLAARLELEVPWTLVLASSIGDAVEVETSVIDGLISVAGAMVGRDLWREGRTLTDVGLGGRDAAALRAYTGGA